jgi:hypothetical protein
MKPLIDISEMIDFTDHIDWDNLMAEHAELDAQHVEFNKKTAEMQSVAPENVASQSSQVDDPMKPLIDISEMIDFTDHIDWDNLMAEHAELDAKHVEFNQKTDEMQSVVPENIAAPQSNSNQLDDPMNPLIDISEMINCTDLIEWDDLMPQKNVFSSNSSQVEVMHSIPQLQYVTAPLKPLDNISLPQVSSTRQFGEFQKLDDLVKKSDQESAAKLVDFNDLAVNKLNDGDSWVKQPDVFERKDTSFLPEIEQECATLDAFHSQPRYGF